jgi:V8-like Glu-specific endopeptidase
VDYVGRDIELDGEGLDQVSVSLIKQFPYCVIGAITAKDSYGHTTRGSGALVSSNLIVTSAHVIFSRRFNKRCQ